ncbi:MAG: double-stranded DNA-binding protein [Candidatus Bathyarchaeota archaeon]
MQEDLELEKLKKRKLKEMERKLNTTPVVAEKRKESPLSVVKSQLVGRGEEVFEAARLQYPTATEIIVNELSILIKSGKIKEPLTGEFLANLYRQLGFPVRLKTRIVYEEHGEIKSLSEKLKGN